MRKVSTNYSHHTGVGTFASRTSPITDQSFQKRFHLSSPGKIEFKKIPPIKKYPTAQPDPTKMEKNSIDNCLQRQMREGHLISPLTRNYSYDSFVIQQSLVRLMPNVLKIYSHAKQQIFA